MTALASGTSPRGTNGSNRTNGFQHSVLSTQYSVLVLRILLGCVLFYAGFVKLKSGWQFAEIIANFRLLPAQANQILAVTLPWCELSAGAMLVFGVWTRPAGLLAALLFGAFTLAVGIALARGLDIACGCFGTGAAARVGLQALGIDLGGLAVAVVVVVGNNLTQRREGAKE